MNDKNITWQEQLRKIIYKGTYECWISRYEEMDSCYGKSDEDTMVVMAECVESQGNE